MATAAAPFRVPSGPPRGLAVEAAAAYDVQFAGAAGTQLAADTQGALDGELGRRGLVFGEDAATARPLCTVLRPRFLALPQFRALMARTSALARAFRQGHALAVADPAVRATLGLQGWEERLLAAAPPDDVPSPTSRLDLFVVDPEGDGTGAIACTEYNAETPAGAGFTDALVDTFLALPAMRAFTRTWHALPVPARAGTAHAVLEAWAAHRARGRASDVAAPTIAILDWDDVATRQEFVLFQRHFRALGLECVIGDPMRCTYDGRALRLDGLRVDVIYKRVLLHELVQRAGEDAAVLRAWADGAVCMVNPPSCKPMHKKASLAVLSDERNAERFDAGAREAIRTMVPWTRVVEARHTEHDGRRVDLLEHVAREKDRFVLKPNDDYGGAGIVLGWTVDGHEWERALAHALAEPYVVQERVAIPSEPYPSWDGTGVAIADRMIDTAPFVSAGAVADGLLTRLSTAALLNVTAGGGSTVPTFVVAPR